MASLEEDYRRREYTLMTNSKRGPLKVQVPNGPLLSCLEGWDYMTNLEKTSFKTTADLNIDNPLVKKELVDMSPASALKAWKYTIYRQKQP